MIFAALSGTFDNAFEVFFSSLGTVVNAIAGPVTERRKSDAVMGVRLLLHCDNCHYLYDDHDQQI
jgi:hypothetical protein